MTTYFAFSDENGSYKRLRSGKFILAHPFYIKTTIYFHSKDWKLLEKGYQELKVHYGLPRHEEIKWSFARTLQKHNEGRTRIKKDDACYFLRDYEPEKLRDFIIESLRLLLDLNYVRLIYTITDNRSCPRIADSKLLKMHLQETMQRIEMDMRYDSENLCVIFVDPVSKEKDKSLRNAYSDLYLRGDFIERYSHIKDSLNVEHSHHSVGIQMADFLAGAMYSKLKDYPLGEKIYSEVIRRIIRRGPNKVITGYGIRVVPRNTGIQIKEALNSLD